MAGGGADGERGKGRKGDGEERGAGEQLRGAEARRGGSGRNGAGRGCRPERRHRRPRRLHQSASSIRIALKGSRHHPWPSPPRRSRGRSGTTSPCDFPAASTSTGKRRRIQTAVYTGASHGMTQQLERVPRRGPRLPGAPVRGLLAISHRPAVSSPASSPWRLEQGAAEKRPQLRHVRWPAVGLRAPHRGPVERATEGAATMRHPPAMRRRIISSRMRFCSATCQCCNRPRASCVREGVIPSPTAGCRLRRWPTFTSSSRRTRRIDPAAPLREDARPCPLRRAAARAHRGDRPSCGGPHGCEWAVSTARRGWEAAHGALLTRSAEAGGFCAEGLPPGAPSTEGRRPGRRYCKAMDGRRSLA